MNRLFRDDALKDIYSKVKNGIRLSREDGLLLYKTQDLNGVGRMADHVRRQRHGNDAFYVYNQHLNYTNICKKPLPFLRLCRG